ncbi:MAG: hypothetical protein Q9O24_13490 [Gammaproteobacteria bacterium]|nr:hypothetical protein [Gammaproteobacteria bacterium]
MATGGSEEISGYIICYVDEEQVVHIIDRLAIDFEGTLSFLLKSFIFTARRQGYVSILMEFYGLESVVTLLASVSRLVALQKYDVHGAFRLVYDCR